MTAPNVFPVYYLQHWKLSAGGRGVGSPWSTRSLMLVSIHDDKRSTPPFCEVAGLSLISSLVKEGGLFRVSLREPRDASIVASLFGWQSVDMIPVLLPGMSRNFDWEIALAKVPVFLEQAPKHVLAREQDRDLLRAAQHA